MVNERAWARGSDLYVETALERLGAAGVRITPARIKILKEISRRTAPVTIDELHQAIGPERHNVATVYRSMTALEGQSLVRMTYGPHGVRFYERMLGEPPRYRIVCKVGDQVQEIDVEAAIRLEEALRGVELVLRGKGYSQVSHRVSFFGLGPANGPGHGPDEKDRRRVHMKDHALSAG